MITSNSFALPTAAEMKRRSDSYLLSGVDDKIFQASANGECFITYATSNIRRLKEVKVNLKKLGYKVTSVKNGNWLDISWCD